ncbi:MAG: amidohydrolase [Chloroflexota bacterium]
MIIFNGKIETMDSTVGTASALLIRNGRIVSVGDGQLMDLARKSEERIDLQGRTVLPGFTDAHIHLLGFAQTMSQIDLIPINSRVEAVELVSEQVKQSSPNIWIQGHGWNQNNWTDTIFPSRVDLDPVSPHNPVLLRAQSGHAAWVNSFALDLAGIDDHSPDPPGGKIVRDSDGSATGLLLEDAMNLVSEVVPKTSYLAAAQEIKLAFESLWKVGITGVHCMDGWTCYEALDHLAAARQLKMRVTKYIPKDDIDQVLGHNMRSGDGNEWLRVGGIKLFTDGALGVRTAAMFDHFEGEPDNYGIMTLSESELNHLVSLASENQLSLAVHAIGDRAVHTVLDALSQLPAPSTVPHRIEHVQLLHPSDVGRLASMGIVASVQPIHSTSDMEIVDRHWGERGAYAYAFRTLLDHGTDVAFGSDAPVESHNPWFGIHAAVTRRRTDGSPSPDGWYPEQRIQLYEAIRGYTLGAAKASGLANKSGSLVPGKYADLIVLDSDPFSMDLQLLHQVKVQGTMIGGEWVVPLDNLN